MARTYRKFILFGDSTVQYMACNHDGFTVQGSLQESMRIPPWPVSQFNILTEIITEYLRRLDFINRGFGYDLLTLMISGLRKLTGVSGAITQLTHFKSFLSYVKTPLSSRGIFLYHPYIF